MIVGAIIVGLLLALFLPVLVLFVLSPLKEVAFIDKTLTFINNIPFYFYWYFFTSLFIMIHLYFNQQPVKYKTVEKIVHVQDRSEFCDECVDQFLQNMQDEATEEHELQEREEGGIFAPRVDY